MGVEKVWLPSKLKVLVYRLELSAFSKLQHRDADGHLSAMGTSTLPRREHVTNPTTDPADYTDEELKQALARVLALARGEVLNDAEVERFWQLYEEILRRGASSGTAA